MSLYRKYRPQKFGAVIGEDHVRDTLLSAIKEGKVGHAYLFAGPRGIGKTTIARLLAKAVNCQKRDELNKSKSGESCDKCDFCLNFLAGKDLDIIEIDAASNRGIDEIRELREKVKFAPTSSKYKVFIIDEVHMLTLPAFNALLKTLEEPPKHAIFILATTEAHKVPATILSRVQRFDFHRISKSDIIKNLKMIAGSEGLSVDDEALEVIAVAAEGSHRDSISLLEQVASLSEKISLTDVRSILGLAKAEEILGVIEAIAKKDSKVAIGIAGGLVDEGVDSSQIVKEITEALRQLLLVKISDGAVDFEVTKERMERLVVISEKFEAGEVNKILEIFIGASQLAKETSIRSLPLEMAIVEACTLAQETRDKKQIPNKYRISNIKNRLSADSQGVKEEKFEAKIEESKSPTADNQPMSGKDIDEKLWKEILERIKSHNHSLNALLRDAQPEGILDGQFILSVKFKFHHDKISEVTNCQTIEKVVGEVLGKKLRLVCQIKENKKSASIPRSEFRPESVGKDLEATAKEIFETE